MTLESKEDGSPRGECSDQRIKLSCLQLMDLTGSIRYELQDFESVFSSSIYEGVKTMKKRLSSMDLVRVEEPEQVFPLRYSDGC